MANASNPMNIVGTISHFFASNRPLSWLVLTAALVFGLLAFWLTPKQYNPEIVRPAFAVTIQYEGATTDAAVDRVVYELVEKVDAVPGVEDIYTTVKDGATIETTAIFTVGYDKTKAKVDLLSQLDQHSYLARGFIAQPQVQEINPETIPILQIGFGLDSLSVPELRQRVVALSHELSNVPDVSDVSVFGGYTESVVVELDTTALAQAGVTIDQLEAALTGGQLRTLRDGMTAEQYQIEVVFDGRSYSAADIGALPVANGVLVRDVSSVYAGATPERTYITYESNQQGGEIVMLSVAKVEGSSAPVVSDAFLAALDETLAQPQYEGVSYEVVANNGETATTEVFGLTQNLLTSIVIVSSVLLLFLSTRAAGVVLVAIPVTLLIVIGLGYLFDQTINRITLFALILSLGLLVDSAIVVVENIFSHLKRAQDTGDDRPRERVIAGAVNEIGVGLLLSTLTSIIVFLPMNFITGMMGPYMGPIAFFVPAALAVSFLVAIVITPFVATHVLRGDDTRNRLTQWFDGVMQRITTGYQRVLQSILSSRRTQKLVLRSALGIFLLSLVLPMTGLVHFQMLPRADRDQFYLYLDLPVDSSVAATTEAVAEIGDVLLADPAVVHMQQFIGTPPILDFNGMFKGAQGRDGTHQATVRVNLQPSAERSRSSSEIVAALRAELAAAHPALASDVRFIEEPPGPPVRATFVAKVAAASSTQQTTVAERLATLVSGVDGLVDIDTSTDAPTSRVRYVFDHAAAAKLGVTPAAAARAVTLLGGAQPVTEFLGSTQAEYTPVVLTLPAEQRDAPADLSQLSVSNQQGEAIPLSAVVSPTTELRPSTVEFADARSVTYVTGAVEERPIIYVVLEVMTALMAGELSEYDVTEWGLFGLTLEDANGNAVAIDWGGEWEMTLENFRDLGIAMGVALALVYGLLVAQYRRFNTPAYILVTVPLGLVGILWGFLLLDQGFSIYLTATALIGFIALIGLVVNNAIIYLEYVAQARRAGATAEEALLEAGAARLRPIFLTSLTTVLGSLTIASDPVWSGLAWAIVFGLSLSTVLTLIIYPTLLAYFNATPGNE